MEIDGAAEPMDSGERENYMIRVAFCALINEPIAGVLHISCRPIVPSRHPSCDGHSLLTGCQDDIPESRGGCLDYASQGFGA